MSRDAVIETIKKTVLSYLPDCRILLFGSHARGDYNRHSDYDLMVIVPNELTKQERLSWLGKLHKDIVQAIHAPIDLLLYSEDEIRRKQELPGHIVRTAMREGVIL